MSSDGIMPRPCVSPLAVIRLVGDYACSVAETSLSTQAFQRHPFGHKATTLMLSACRQCLREPAALLVRHRVGKGIKEPRRDRSSRSHRHQLCAWVHLTHGLFLSSSETLLFEDRPLCVCLLMRLTYVRRSEGRTNWIVQGPIARPAHKPGDGAE